MTARNKGCAGGGLNLLFDISRRYIAATCPSSVRRCERGPSSRRPRPRGPGTAARQPAARLRAAQAARHRTGSVPGAQLRHPLPLPQAPVRAGLDHRVRVRTSPRRADAPASSTSSRPPARSTSSARRRVRAGEWEDESFGVRFAFFARTPHRGAVAHPRGRRSRLEERLDQIRTSVARSRERADQYTLELQRHGLESVEREVRWLNELISHERGEDQPPAPTRHASTAPSHHAPSTVRRHREVPDEGAPHGIRPCSHRRRRQLRRVARPGRALLPDADPTATCRA